VRERARGLVIEVRLGIRSLTYTQRKVRLVNIFVKAEGPSGRAKIHSERPKARIGSGPLPANYRLQRLD
jgi:hypothetical protein